MNGKCSFSKNPEISRMKQILFGVVSRNLITNFLAVILCNASMVLVMFFVIQPLLKILNGSSGGNFFATLALIFSVNIVFEILNAGLIKFSTESVLGKNPSLFTVFSGFENPKIFFTSIFFTVIYLVSAFGSGLILKASGSVSLLSNFNFNDFESIDYNALGKVFSIFAVSFTLIYFILKLPFLFMLNVIFQNPEKKFFSAVAESVRILFPVKMFHWTFFLIRSVVKNFLFIILILVFSVFVKMPLVALFLEFFTFVQILTVLLKYNFSIPVYYYSCLAVNGLVENESEGENLSVQLNEPNNESEAAEQADESEPEEQAEQAERDVEK